MIIDQITLNQVKSHLRVSGNEFDEVLSSMLKCACEVALQYIEPAIIQDHFEIIKQGILAHVTIMFDAKYLSANLPTEILQYYKPFIRHKL